MASALGGMVLTEGAPQLDDPPEAGDIINVNGRDHVVLGVRGNYDIERDTWEVVLKLAALREPDISGREPPGWVADAVHPDA